jgi:endogenous inhibitor of DNA gyrase (YacG/DUF329 family)
MKVNCPICKKMVEIGTGDFPFCSDRCRNIDLGNWATEKYVISEPLQHSPDAEVEED